MLNKNTRSIIVEQLRDLAEAFRKHDPQTAKAIRLIAADADAGDLDETRKHYNRMGVHIRAAVMDLAPVAYDWIRFGVAWSDAFTKFTDAEVAMARKFLKKHRGDRHVAYNAALQKLIRTEKEEYATIAAWCRSKQR